MAELTEALLLIKVSRNTLYLDFLSYKINSLYTLYSFHGFAHNIMDILFLCQKRKSQQIRDLGFMEDADNSQESSVTELRAAHAETIQELEKTRNLLNMESQISKDYKVEEDTYRPAKMSKHILFTFIHTKLVQIMRREMARKYLKQQNETPCR